MDKRIVTRDELIAPKIAGMKLIAGIVKRTLGPGGLPIMIQRLGEALDGTRLGPKITKDGVSVAEECESSIPEEDVVIQAVKAICKRTNVIAGDGTTTAIVLGEALVIETEKALKENPSLNPQLVKESIEAALKDVLLLLKDATIPVDNMDMVKEVATISANGDETIGRVISEAFEKVGAEGVVTVDEGHTNDVTLEVVEGYQFNRGAEGRTAFFSNKEQTQFEAEDVAVIIYDGKMFNYTDLIPALRILAGVEEGSEKPTKKMPSILLIANEFSNDVLQFLNIQKMEGGMSVVPVVGPNATHVRSGYYDDLAVYTGGTRLGNGNRSLSAIEEDDIGLVKKVIVDKYKTTLYEGQGSEDEVLLRVEQLRALKARAESPYDVQILNDRTAAITNGIAKICVGGNTELEIKEKYDRIEDALNAARAAIQDGVVPGGGTTLLRIADTLDPHASIGHAILAQALQSPFFQILENIGVDPIKQHAVKQDVLNAPGVVYDARNKVIADALKSGIIDPVKVTKTALENAVSISSLLSTAGGAIIFVPPKK
jgi:chaperonin GroEL